MEAKRPSKKVLNSSMNVPIIQINTEERVEERLREKKKKNSESQRQKQIVIVNNQRGFRP